MIETRETRLVETFVTLTDNLVADYDVLDVLQTLVDRSVELFDAAAGAIHLLNRDGVLEVAASTSERSEFIGLLQLNAGEGPCIAAVTSGELVTSEDVGSLTERWPRFAAASRDHGYRSVHAIPLRLREEVIGSLNLFREMEGALNGADARAAQALADVATISILQQRTMQDAAVTAEQLQHALDAKVPVEQAKGYVARALSVDVDTAREVLRGYARRTQRKLSAVAVEVADGELTLDELVAGATGGSVPDDRG
ncbi:MULTISPECIES: GAF and ANTAR domain-containing protein [unclassified Curtobacterium]|uniref:GAF and ANTAR domain-containing protein n=1 Tax=unclassified Curtobacterium TaxID=257496 RepID=UPI0008255360|nr:MULTISPECIES: GAF and ANTAR domain-containing protein [unclassified Curtobacterium]WIA96276.1 GAF and ANTAR domain-containing protein [Curtobacterium sp. MCBA15_004]WIA99577.1 GAF and ANTAR domain-containing protein [Curtobacterium sp. MCBA15_012]